MVVNQWQYDPIFQSARIVELLSEYHSEYSEYHPEYSEYQSISRSIGVSEISECRFPLDLVL